MSSMSSCRHAGCCRHTGCCRHCSCCYIPVSPKPKCIFPCACTLSIPTLLCLWVVFDLFCCSFLCDPICQLLSTLLLLATIVKIVISTYEIILNYITCIEELHDFKCRAEPKLACIDTSLHSMQLDECGISVQPSTTCLRHNSHCGDPPIYVECGRCCTPRSRS